MFSSFNFNLELIFKNQSFVDKFEIEVERREHYFHCLQIQLRNVFTKKKTFQLLVYSFTLDLDKRGGINHLSYD